MLEVKMCEFDELEEWDRFVKSHPWGEIYHTRAWKKIIEKSFHHIQAKNLILRHKENGYIMGALPLFQVRSWLTGNRLVSVPFGTLSDPLVNSATELENLLEYALRIKDDLHCKGVQIGLFRAYDIFKQPKFYKEKTHKHHFLSLEKDFNQLIKKFKRTVRQALNRAIASGLNVIEGSDKNDLRAFYRLYMETRKRNNVPTQPFLFFCNLWEELNPNGILSLLLVKKDQSVICGAIILKFKNRVTLEFLASNSDFLSLRPNHLLVWSAIKKAHEEGYEVFDFGRTATEDEGLMKFKQSWGTSEIDLGKACLRDSKNQNIYDRQTVRWRVTNFLSHNLPHPFYQLFSSYIYRHSG